MQRLTREEFEALVEDALDSLPEEFAKLLENIAVVVEEEPSDDDLDSLDDDDEEGDDEDELLGIYRGVSLPDRSFDMMPLLPDQIAIFRGPILRVTSSRKEAIREVRDTVIHELGHYFGLEDDDMPY
jgi:predicted Zn-dependent protease with MMP-like domain